MSDMPEVIYAYPSDYSDPECPNGGWDTNEICEPLDRVYYSAEKAKADKLAMVNEIKGFVGAEYIPPPEGFVNEVVKENNETVDVLLAQIESIKQRIEAE